MLALQPGKIGTLTLPNRIIRAPVSENMSGPNGEATPEVERIYVDLARGGVGLIMAGHFWVHPRGRATMLQLGLHDDVVLPSMTRMTQAVHDAGGRIFAELAHAGSQTRLKIVRQLGPSAVANPQYGTVPDEMTEAQIEEAIEAYRTAALRALRAGFDGIHISGANGYLMSQFNSPWTNRRTDRWGGDAERRGRFVLETIKAIRSAIGPDVPFVARIGVCDADTIPNGMTLDEGMARVERIAALRVLDAIEPATNMISDGTQGVRPYVGVNGWRAAQDLLLHRVFTVKPPEEAYFLPWAREIRRRTDLKIMLMGGIRSTQVMEKILSDGDADFVAMGRPFIRQPDFVRKMERGYQGKVDCVSCNACRLMIRSNRPLRCWRTPKWRLGQFFWIHGRHVFQTYWRKTWKK